MKNFNEGSLERGRWKKIGIVKALKSCVEKNKANFYISFVLKEEARSYLCIGQLFF